MLFFYFQNLYRFTIRLVLFVKKVPKIIQDNKTRYRPDSSLYQYSSRSNSCCPETPFLYFMTLLFESIISKTPDSSSSLDQMSVLGVLVPYLRVLLG